MVVIREFVADGVIRPLEVHQWLLGGSHDRGCERIDNYDRITLNLVFFSDLAYQHRRCLRNDWQALRAINLIAYKPPSLISCKALGKVQGIAVEGVKGDKATGQKVWIA